MKRILSTLLVLLALALPAGADQIYELNARVTLALTDIIECEDAANDSFKCTMSEVGELLETEIELQDLNGAVTDAQVPDTITIDEATNVTDADFGDIVVGLGAWTLDAGVVDAAAIGANVITEAEVEGGASLGAPEDGYVWAWNDTSGAMEFVSNAAGSETDPTLTDDQAVTIGDGTGADVVLTADSTTDGTITWDLSALTWVFSHPVSVPPSATPSVSLTDSDTTDEDVSAKVEANCTATGTGAENCDLSLIQQIAGADVTTISMDADGVTAIKRLQDFESVTIEDPLDADNFLLFKAPYAITITDIDCIVDPGDSSESVVIDIQERNGTGGSPSSVDAAITCDNDGAADDGTFTNAPIDAGDWVSIDIGTVTGTVTQVSATITYTRD